MTEDYHVCRGQREMAPISVTAVPPPTIPTKPKRPTPAGVQTNGASSIRSSPSPSLKNKKPPATGKSVAFNATSSSSAPNGITVTPVRPPSRPPRMPPAQINGTGAGSIAKSNGVNQLVLPRVDPSVSVNRRPYSMPNPSRAAISFFFKKKPPLHHLSFHPPPLYFTTY